MCCVMADGKQQAFGPKDEVLAQAPLRSRAGRSDAAQARVPDQRVIR